MANEFYVQITDQQGNVVASKGFAVYPTYADAQAGTNALTTVPTPLTTDSNGEKTFTVSDPNIETVYMKATGETYVEGVRCANRPLPTAYTTIAAATVDGAADLVLLWDYSAAAYKKITIDELAAKVATAAGYVTGSGTSRIYYSTTTPTGTRQTGDIWVKPGT